MPEDTSPKLSKAPSVAQKAPSAWAHAKGHVAPERPAYFAPWEYGAARVMQRWPDEQLDPSFAISEQEYDAAIEAVLAITLG